MEPILHQMYAFDDAVTSFGNEALPEFFCQHNYVVIPKAVICLITLGDPSTDSFLQSPTSLIWKRPDCRSWLPGKVTEVWDRSGKESKKIRDHHIFLRSQENESFFYAGPAHLGSFGGPDYSANFFLETKLPRDVWLRYGGFPGWLVDVNHEMHRVSNGDLQNFRRLASSLRDNEFSHLHMTRYEEDSLTLHTNECRGWLMYLREPADSGLYTRDTAYPGAPETEEVFRCGCGIDLEFPSSATLPRNIAIRVAEEFFEKGELPESVPWTSSIPGL